MVVVVMELHSSWKCVKKDINYSFKMAKVPSTRQSQPFVSLRWNQTILAPII
jgi:hypothetical protein